MPWCASYLFSELDKSGITDGCTMAQEVRLSRLVLRFCPQFVFSVVLGAPAGRRSAVLFSCLKSLCLCLYPLLLVLVFRLVFIVVFLLVHQVEISQEDWYPQTATLSRRDSACALSAC